MNTKAKLAVGILGAVAAGVVIGLLMAPEKGSDTRKKLRKKAGSWADTIGHLFSNGKEATEEVKDKVRTAKAVAEEKASKLKDSLS